MPRTRRRPATVRRARQVRRLRDVERCRESGSLPTGDRRVNGDLPLRLDLERSAPADPLSRVERVMYLTAAMTGHAPGRAVRAALARRRLAGASRPRAAQLRPRRVRDAQVTSGPRAASRWPTGVGRRARAASPRRRAVRRDDDLVFAHPAHRQADRPLQAAQALQGGAAPGRCPRRSLPRPAAHVRHAHGRAGVPMRTLQEWMGHRDFKTTLIYADYAPSARTRPSWSTPPSHARVHQFVHQFEQNHGQVKTRNPCKYDVGN